MGAALAVVGCGREQNDLTAPKSQALSFSQLGQGFVSIDYPGATYTTAQSISPLGKIVGQYLGADGLKHGFLLFQGTFTALPDVPGAIESVPNRLNAQGTIVGTYRDALREHAYVLSNGTFTTIDFPDPSISLAGWGISDDGDVVGPKFIEGDFPDAHGYVFGKNTFTLFDFPGAMGTFPTAIIDNGNIVGAYLTTDNAVHGFLLSNGTFSTIHFPNSTFDWVNDVNLRGEIVGFYNDQDGVQHGFVQSKGAFKSIDPPGSITTSALGINPQGDVVGQYVTPDGNTHGWSLACAARNLSACSP
jgi:uncharacterized membrane protein